MTVHLNLPKDLEERLLAQVQAGRHPSLEAAIMEKLSHEDNPDLLRLIGLDRAQIRSDLDAAWSDREGTADGDEVFAKIAARSKELKAQGR